MGDPSHDVGGEVLEVQRTLAFCGLPSELVQSFDTFLLEVGHVQDVVLLPIDPASQFPLGLPFWLGDNLLLLVIKHGQIVPLEQGSFEFYRMLDDFLAVVVVVLKLMSVAGPLC